MVVNTMLANNDKICTFKICLEMCKCIKGEHRAITMNCGVFQKMSTELKDKFS